ncbi:MAG: RING finger domain protein [Barrevirus sp.]|uniref:RING finger domain protein n=1 Tax=Barrevirus sp. TaxID=2487763 RepID=A0A3G4ZT92_9VIRU|nr:MAG: RING finger domain protein [Barrevirus sp.]
MYNQIGSPSPKITNIRSLYLSEIVNSKIRNHHFYWYRSNELFDDITIANSHNRTIIQKTFTEKNFPEYIQIAYAIISYIDNKKYKGSESKLTTQVKPGQMNLLTKPGQMNPLLKPSQMSSLSKPIHMNLLDKESDSDSDTDTDSEERPGRVNRQKIINVLVDEKSRFAKGHEALDQEKGFISLFRLVMNNDIISYIEVNYLLISPYIKLINDPPSLIPEYNEDLTLSDITMHDNKDKNCHLCLSNLGILILSDCNHTFHLSCLKCVAIIECPTCKASLTNTLLKQGITEKQIKSIIEKEERIQQLVEHSNKIPFDELEKMDDSKILAVCLETLRLNNGNVSKYHDIILEQNTHASSLFLQISNINSQIEPGFFFYNYDSATEFLMQQLDLENDSIVQWLPLSQVTDKDFMVLAQSILAKTRLPDEYLIIIIIDNFYSSYIINKNKHNAITAPRMSQKDILRTISTCVWSNLFPDPKAYNRELVWAQNAMDKLKKQRDNRNKKRNRKIRNKLNKVAEASPD